MLPILLQIAGPTTAPYCHQPDAVIALITQIIGVSFMTMVLLLSLFWMAAQFFKRPEYESFVSVEVHQLLVSAILFVTIFGAVLFSCELSVMFSGGDPFDLSTSYLNNISNNVALHAVLKLEATKALAQYWGSMTFRWGLTVWGVATPAFPSFIMVERIVDFLLMLITPFTASLMTQEIILETIKGIAVPFILPAGLVLRMYPPTRGAGSFLLAAAIGFGIVYPYTYVMHKAIVEQMMDSTDMKQTMQGLFGEDSLKDGLWPWAVFSNGLFDIKTMLFNPIDVTGFLLLQALFLPALSITITVSFIKGMAKFFSQKLEG